MFDPHSSEDESDLFPALDDTHACSIYQAAGRNDKNTLRKLLMERKENPFPLLADNQDWTALHMAAFRPQYKDCLELLLEYRDSVFLDINAQTIDGKTAFYIACENGCEKSVEMLLQSGCHIDTRTVNGDTPLLAAICGGNLKVVEFSINFLTAHINRANNSGITPLHRSAMFGYLEMSRILLKRGADAQSIIYEDGYLPLHFACLENHFDVARLLVKNALTTINVPTVDGSTPLMVALEDGECNIEFIRFLLDNGASTDTYNKEGKIALHFAACRGDVDILQLILENTKASSIHRCLLHAIGTLKAGKSLYSFTSQAIHSENVKCLEILLLSPKLSKGILETPLVGENDNDIETYSPLANLFATIDNPELWNSFLQLLLKHEITMFDEFLKTFPGTWLHDTVFIHPFFFIVERPISEQQHYFDLFDSNNLTSDYCSLLHHQNNTFDTFTDYWRYYEFVGKVLFHQYSTVPPGGDWHLETLKLLMSTSVILEPDVVCIEFNPLLDLPSNPTSWPEYLEERREMYQYLISLKPVYFTEFRLLGLNNETDVPRFPYATLDEEFAQSTLQQLCRTVIRHHLREPTLDDNLRNFKRKILELPLPTRFKNYLLFKE